MSVTPNSRPRGSFTVIWALMILVIILFLVFQPGQGTTAMQASPKRPVASQQVPTSDHRAAALEAEFGPYIGNWHELASLPLPARLKWLVEHHPHDDVRVKLADMLYGDRLGPRTGPMPGLQSWIKVKQIAWSLDPNNGTHAAFGVRPIQGVDVSVPILLVHPELLESYVDEKMQVIYAMLVLYHETQHVLQFFDDPTDPNFQMVRVQEFAQSMNPEACSRSWHHEVDVYLKECTLARAWDFDPDYIDCSSYKATANSFTKATLTQRPEFAACKVTFDNLTAELPN